VLGSAKIYGDFQILFQKAKTPRMLIPWGFLGVPEGIRTPDLLTASQKKAFFCVYRSSPVFANAYL